MDSTAHTELFIEGRSKELRVIFCRLLQKVYIHLAQERSVVLLTNERASDQDEYRCIGQVLLLRCVAFRKAHLYLYDVRNAQHDRDIEQLTMNLSLTR